MVSRAFATALLWALAGGLGCNSGTTFYDVTGNVTCDGKPIEEGEIVFIAVDNGSTPGASKIQNGTYHLKMPAGKKKVRIAASRKVPGKGAMGEDFVYQSYVPPRYNDQTTLEAEITPGAANQFDFRLDTKPNP
ncbi:MAG: hypothetical protein C0467_07430 [Planctomycetaceae bacterium]|nr:hypothetical protein [Planctomycetaceae bacterium]